jgi:hypothetical protein
MHCLFIAVAYFKRISTGERISTITTTLGDETERFVLVTEINDKWATAVFGRSLIPQQLISRRPA